MNAQELREKRREYLIGIAEDRYGLGDNIEGVLDHLESLDAEQKRPVNEFHQFTNLLDMHVKLRGQTQGRPASEILVLDTIVAEALKRITALKESEK